MSSRINLSGKELDDYLNAGHQLYNYLLKPISIPLPDHLIVIPDGPLGYLSFEAFLVDPTSVLKATSPFVLQEHSIS